VNGTAESETCQHKLTMKVVVLARYDLHMTAGKLAAQVGHAIHSLIRDSEESILENWEEDDSGSKIVVLGVTDLHQMLRYTHKAEQCGIGVFQIEDAGKTEVAPGSLTVAAIGPCYEEILDSITGDLRPYKEPKHTTAAGSCKMVD
jgi:PTH2 family peptidyl-tRNA hydrolase